MLLNLEQRGLNEHLTAHTYQLSDFDPLWTMVAWKTIAVCLRGTETESDYHRQAPRLERQRTVAELRWTIDERRTTNDERRSANNDQ